jgi:hypothetical protein
MVAGVWLDVALLLTVSVLEKIKNKSFCFFPSPTFEP